MLRAGVVHEELLADAGLAVERRGQAVSELLGLRGHPRLCGELPGYGLHRRREMDEKAKPERVTFVIERVEMSKRVRDLARKHQPKVALPGFRKGKVPVAVIESRMADALRHEAVLGILQDALGEDVNRAVLQGVVKEGHSFRALVRFPDERT